MPPAYKSGRSRTLDVEPRTEGSLSCSRCKEVKPCEEFFFNKQAPARGYRHWYCRDCHRARREEKLGRPVQPYVPALHVGLRAEAKRRYLAGESAESLAVEFGVGSTTIINAVEGSKRSKGRGAGSYTIDVEQRQVVVRRYLAGETMRDIARDYLVCASTISRVIHLAGHSARKGPGRKWTRERITETIREWHVVHGRPPTWNEWRSSAEDRPTSSTVRKAFGSFSYAMTASLPNEGEAQPSRPPVTLSV